MELTTTKRAEVATTAKCNAAWAVDIRNRYGELTSALAKFGLKSQRYCAVNMELAFKSNVPSLVRMVRTYGAEGMAKLIATHMSDAISCMGESPALMTRDIDFISAAICENERFNTLKVSTVIGFFYYLKTGAFDIYGQVNPRKILEAFRKYAETATMQEDEQYRLMEKQKQREEAEKHASDAISWEQFAATAGYTAGSLHEQMAIEIEKANIGREIADFLVLFRNILQFLTDPKTINAV